jgi:hypothetical protein
VRFAGEGMGYEWGGRDGLLCEGDGWMWGFAFIGGSRKKACKAQHFLLTVFESSFVMKSEPLYIGV